MPGIGRRAALAEHKERTARLPGIINPNKKTSVTTEWVQLGPPHNHTPDTPVRLYHTCGTRHQGPHAPDNRSTPVSIM